MKYYVFVSYDYSNGELIEFDVYEKAFEFYQEESKFNDSALLYGELLNKKYFT